MKVTLAGFNVENTDCPVRTPEVLSAAYARVSRSEKSLSQLRQDARENVEKARKSNQSIVYDMGHASIAEHAFFNIDIEDISRLALEELEKHRLASYTEKSQRYVKLDSDWHLPAEWENHRADIEKLHEQAVNFYRRLMENGVPGEDARYYLPLCITGQVGLSCNARTAEHLILRLAASPLAEARELGALFHACLTPVVPSLVRYVEPSDWCRLEEAAHMPEDASLPESGDTPGADPESAVTHEGAHLGSLRLCSPPDDWDACVIAAQAVRRGEPFARALERARNLPAAGRDEELARMMAGMSVHDPAPRAWEHVHLSWEIVLSSAAFAQLKRHRLCDVAFSPYHERFGFTHPPTIPAAHREEALRLVQAAQETARIMPGPARAYALLAGHRRRVLWTANLRELLHFSRLREDGHAQWDIRAFAHAVSDCIRRYAPCCGRYFGGKDAATGRLP